MLSPACAEATGALLSALLGALDRIGVGAAPSLSAARRPARRALAPHAERLAEPLAALRGPAWPDDLRFLRERLAQVARQALELIDAFGVAAATGEPIGLYRALRRFGAAPGGALPAGARCWSR